MRKIIITLCFSFTVFAAHASSDVIKQWVPEAKEVGSGRLSVVFWDIYDATLYAPLGKWNPNKPYALSIHYFREIDGNDIADRSAKEIRGQGFHDEVRLAAWHSQMRDIFPDITPGDVLTAIAVPGKGTYFYESNRRIGAILDNEFSKRFFDIWLSEKTSEPALRAKLIGKV